MGFLNNNKRIFDQDYNKIKKICIKNNSLFIDTTFPPTDESLFLESGKNSEIVWKRPSELVDNPKLFVEGASFGDVQQGILGNCWCLSAFLGLTLNKSLMNKVLPDCTKQEWNSNNHYVGIFKFSFWRYGKWENIIIDDLLPTKNNELLFARSKTPNEFWPALLEKAFAKMYGCYENLSGGQLSDALLDVSGGVPENIVFAKFLESEECDRNQKISKLFKLLEREFACQSLMVAAIGAKGGENEEVLSNGLILRHAYAITAVRYIELDAKNASFKYFSKLEKKMMIRLRNPWAEGEYNGAWSDASEEWNQVSVLQKKELGIVLDDDGDFWMNFTDFISNFTDLSICRILNHPESNCCDSIYKESRFFGAWATNGRSGAPNDRSGGGLNFFGTATSNPQYAFDVKTDDSIILLTLTQKDKSEGKKERAAFVPIGMYVMKVEINRDCRIHQLLDVIATSDYVHSRSAFLSLKNLKIGRYIVVPSTYAPRETGEYIFRIFTQDCKNIKELKNDVVSVPKIFSCYTPRYVMRLTVKYFELQNIDAKSSRFYCVVKTRQTSVKSRKIVGDLNFNENFLFHCFTGYTQFRIQLWSDSKTKKSLVGESLFSEISDNEKKVFSIELLKSQSSSISVGRINLEICSYDDPMYL